MIIMSISKQQIFCMNINHGNIQEVHDVEAFERGTANAASVRRQAKSPFPLKFHDHPGLVTRGSQTVVIPLSPTVPENIMIPRIDRELESF
jgi:hypothetical protein